MSKTKTYWKVYAEKNKTPEFLNSSQKEFQEKIPVEEFLAEDGIQDLKTGRRDFLKFMGFSVAAASLASCEAPIIKSIPYVNKPEDITPGIANWYSSTFYDGNNYDFANEYIQISLFPSNEEKDEFWIGDKNLYAITRYNPSSKYAMSVFLLSEELKN